MKSSSKETTKVQNVLMKTSFHEANSSVHALRKILRVGSIVNRSESKLHLFFYLIFLLKVHFKKHKIFAKVKTNCCGWRKINVQEKEIEKKLRLNISHE